MASRLWDLTWCRILHHLTCWFVLSAMCFNTELGKPTGSMSQLWCQIHLFILMFRIYFKVEHQGGCQLNFASKRSINGCSLKSWLNSLMIPVINWNFYHFIQRNPAAKFLIILPTHWNQGEGRKISVELPDNSQLLFWLLSAHSETKTDSKIKRNWKISFDF